MGEMVRLMRVDTLKSDLVCLYDIPLEKFRNKQIHELQIRKYISGFTKIKDR